MTHPLVIWGMYLPVIGFMLYYSSAIIGNGLGQTTAVFITGMFGWSLQVQELMFAKQEKQLQQQ